MLVEKPIRQPSIDEDYHVASKNQAARKYSRVSHYVHYSESVQELVAHAPLRLDGRPRLQLPPPVPLSNIRFDSLIESRISGRDFQFRALRRDHLSTLLYLGNAVRKVAGTAGNSQYRRNVPNSGNLGSVEIYLVIMNVESVEPGIYHFDSVSHEIVQIRKGDFAAWLREHCLYQIEFGRASVALALTAAIGRLKAKYGLRSYRLALLDAGHVSQNIYLVAAALGLTVCATAGFIDDEINEALEIDGLDNATMLVSLVG